MITPISFFFFFSFFFVIGFLSFVSFCFLVLSFYTIDYTHRYFIKGRLFFATRQHSLGQMIISAIISMKRYEEKKTANSFIFVSLHDLYVNLKTSFGTGAWWRSQYFVLFLPFFFFQNARRKKDTRTTLKYYICIVYI